MRRLLQSIIANRKLYDRPQDEWTCGRAAEGCPCVFGPDAKGECRATTQCLPAKKGDRWVCTRAISLGGPCQPGPHPDGACGCAVPPCLPVQSLRARRQRLTWLIASLTAGVVVLGLWGAAHTIWSNPGPLTAPHAMSAQRCADCHGETGGVALTAAARAERMQENNQLCLKCHDLGEHSQSAHGVDVAQLRELSRRTQAGASPPSLMQRAAHGLASGRPAELACATCHQEHHGRDANMRLLSDQQCQTCHQAPFASFTSGHPEFTAYPSTRRTRLQFDHVTHWQKYFSDPRLVASAPTSCAQCHEPAADGRKMLVRGFEQACAQCHNGQIEGEGRAGAKGLVFFRLPEVDVATLERAGELMGEWPEFCEGGITPFMRWMLEGDANARKALADLGPAKLADLTHATPAQKNAAARLVWSVKALMADLITQGQPVIMRRVDPQSPGLGTTRHTGNFSPDSVQAAQQAWLPGLLTEVAAHRRGEKPVARPAKLHAAVGKTTSISTAVTSAASDDLLADPAPAAPTDKDDLLAVEAPVAAAAVPAPVLPTLPAIQYDDAEARVAEGGWYRRDNTYTLYYRPNGHADEFLTAWLETSASDPRPAAQEIFADLASPQAPGVCMKCHTADGTGITTKINWLTSRPQPHQHPFTTFKHAPHFSLMGVPGCSTCHVFDAKADYAGAFGANRDSAVFHSSFAPLTKESCVSCHQPTMAGASCLQCHNYHTGELSRLQLKTAEFSGATIEGPAAARNPAPGR